MCVLEFYHGRSGVAAGFNTRPALNISTHPHPILPLTKAGFQQNQILSTYPLLPDSGRSDSDLRFGPFGGAARPPPHPTWPGPTGPGRGPPRGAGGGGRLSAPAPTCPIELISGRSMAWDCKTGNGNPGIQEFKNLGIQGSRDSGIEQFGQSGIQGYRIPGILDFRNPC